MIFWLIPVAISVVFLAWFLIKVLKQYDSESIGVLFERLTATEDRLETLQERLETLEAIESDRIIDLQKSKEMPDSAESLSSGRKHLIE